MVAQSNGKPGPLFRIALKKIPNVCGARVNAAITRQRKRASGPLVSALSHCCLNAAAIPPLFGNHATMLLSSRFHHAALPKNKHRRDRMSDMRDFNAPGNISEEIRPQRDPLLEGENHSLGEFHVIETEESGNTGRILGALAVALLLGTAGGYAYYASQKAPAAPVANQMAAVSPPPAAAPAPDNSQAVNNPAPVAPSDAMPSSQPASSQPVSAPAPSAPVSSHRVRAARADTSASPGQPQAVTTEPNAPTLVPDQSAAAQPAAPAGNPSLARNEQNGADVTAPAVQAPAIPTPAATPAPGVQPAPAAPSDQPAAQ
jgi:hypothetical protein